MGDRIEEHTLDFINRFLKPVIEDIYFPTMPHVVFYIRNTKYYIVNKSELV